MEKTITNFTEDIHNDDYSLNYMNPFYDAASFICDAGREKEKLDGMWNFSTDQYDYCLRGKWYEENFYDKDGRPLPRDYDFDDWETLKVPGVWNTQKPEYFHYEGPGVYSRRFLYVNHGESKVVLKFGAVYYNARIFLNGVFAGFHRGGSTPFYVDVTKLLKKENRIIVVADNERRRTQLPSINTDWFNYGGITRSVELIRLPKAYIKQFSVHLGNGGKKGAGTAVNSASAKLAAGRDSLGKAAGSDVIEAFVQADIPADYKGKVSVKLQIPELKQEETFSLTKEDNGLYSVTTSFAATVEKWSPESPKLYKVMASLYLDDETCDSVSDDIGFRTIEVKKGKIVLNGQPIYLNGVACHEESAPNGKAVTKEEAEENIRIAKEMGCNFMRLAHYPHNEDVARLADKMGILLWEEIPVYWLIAFKNEDTYNDAENQLTELILRDRNRASVIIWSVGNENPDTDDRLSFMSRLAIHAKKLDPTRLVSAACLVDHVHLKIADRLEEYLDVIGLNEYYGWYNPDFEQLPRLMANSNPAKPVVISEFGADALSGHYGTIDQKGTETCQEYIYKKQTELFSRIPFIQGTCPWILFDFRTPRRMSAWQKGRNTKGLLSEDKKHRKLAFYVMQEFYKRRGTKSE